MKARERFDAWGYRGFGVVSGLGSRPDKRGFEERFWLGRKC